MKFPLFLSLAGTLVPLHAADISSWRNDGNGLYPGTKAATDWTQPSQTVWETALPAASILAFWHIPWPNPESFGICPWRREIL